MRITTLTGFLSVSLAALLITLLTACVTRIPVSLRMYGDQTYSFSPAGNLNIRGSSVRFEPNPSHSDVNYKMALLIDILDDIKRSEPYEREKSEIALIVLGENSPEIMIVLKNQVYLSFEPDPSQWGGVNAKMTIATKRGEFVVEEGMLVSTDRGRRGTTASK